MESSGVRTLEEVLTSKQVQDILDQVVGSNWQLLGSDIKPAAVGLSGFLGDHFRVTFHVKIKKYTKKLHIFVKSIPLANKPKARYIDENNYNRREMLMFQLFEKMQAYADESNVWCAKAYICTENILVMPDLLYQGYRQRPTLECLDLKHALLAATSIARFHAAFANYETNRQLNGHAPFKEEYSHLLQEPIFKDSPWLRAAAKLTKNFLFTFSDKCGHYPQDLDEILLKLYIEACSSFTEAESLNVVNHKDLWVNNIMFKYEGDAPISAVLIDFQCIRYGPPAFDLMVFLYLNTSRSFRKKYETMIFRHYYVIFAENLDDSTKDRLHLLGYDFDVFVGWCHKARMFGMVETIGIFPYILMEPAVAQRTFDEPETFMKYCDEDRTEPVVAHARQSGAYRQRQLEVCEEFVERYVSKQSC